MKCLQGKEDEGGFGPVPEKMRQYLSSRHWFDASWGRQTLYPCLRNLALYVGSPPIRIKEEDTFELHVFR